METLVDNDIMPFVFYEGVWDQRLKYLAELPRGKTAGWFQFSDIFKVKEVVGETMAITGGMRNSMLQAGTAEEVRAFTKRLCAEVGQGWRLPHERRRRRDGRLQAGTREGLGRDDQGIRRVRVGGSADSRSRAAAGIRGRTSLDDPEPPRARW